MAVTLLSSKSYFLTECKFRIFLYIVKYVENVEVRFYTYNNSYISISLHFHSNMEIYYRIYFSSYNVKLVENEVVRFPTYENNDILISFPCHINIVGVM